MASILKVDTLTGVTTAGSVAVTGEGNSTTTNLQQGLTKLWSCWDSSSGSSKDSFNSASLTDNATGRWTNNFTNNMGNANYTLSGGAAYTENSSGNTTLYCEHDNSDYGRTTSAVTTESAYNNTNSGRTLYDYTDVACQVNGDLA